VLDEPVEEEQEVRVIKPGKPGCPEEEPEPCEFGEGPITRHFRLQKFAASGGKYSAVAAASVIEEAPTLTVAAKKPTEAEVGFAESFGVAIALGAQHGRALVVEGVAVDPGLKRLYALVADLRLPALAIDNVAGESPLFENQALPVAATLYAFSTQPEGTTLKPAVGATPVLTSPATLGAQSGQSGQALLEPAGITVDPATHEVIVLGHVDEAGTAQDRIENAKDHFALQRIRPDGTLGARYVDRTNFFAKEPAPELRPHSPIVVGPEHAESVYVGYQQGLVQIPYNFESAESPKAFFTPPPSSIVGEWIKAPLAAGAPGVKGSLVGGALTVSPEGTVFSAATIHLEEKEGSEFEAVMGLSGADGSVLGWTGGQSQNPEAKASERYLCVIEPLFYSPFAPVAAGSGGNVFVLAPAYLFDRELNSPSEITLYGPPSAPAVIELGPGGSGCPTAKSREGLLARVKGEPLGEHPVKGGEQVTFSTELLQADSLRVDWDFGDGSKETVSIGQRKHPETRHAFTHSGTMTVTATIHTDDLATPTITLTTHVKVSEVGGTAPRAMANGPLEAIRGVPALFDGSASSAPSGANQIAEYHWVFGDGQQQTSSEPIAFHTYASIGSYTASLTVTDRHGLTSAPYTLPHPVKVIEETVEEPPLQRQGAGTAPSPTPSASAVAGYTNHAPPLVPVVTLAGASLRASAGGAVTLLLYCPAGESTCAGTVTLTALVVTADKGHRRKTARVTLASGAFTLSGGTQKRVVLRLSREARALLARMHSLHAQTLIKAHDPAGGTHTTQLAVNLTAASSAGAKHGKH
jgi:hypothetical protein